MLLVFQWDLPKVFQLFNPKTKTIVLTKDVTFLQKSYGDYSKVKKPVLTMSGEGSDDDEELKTVPVINQNNKFIILRVMKKVNKTFSTRILMKKLKQPPRPLSTLK